VQGDVRMISADAVLYPTWRIDDPKWFPSGPPDGARSVDRALFTATERVHMAPGTPPGAPQAWLSWLGWEGEGTPPVDFFTDAADAFIRRASDNLASSGRGPICSRQLPLLALPVIGTGSSGAKPIAGALLSALLLLLARFVATTAVDVVLVTKSRRMVSESGHSTRTHTARRRQRRRRHTLLSTDR
jgi:hypothetical protein